MRLHPNLCIAVVDNLQEIFLQGRLANQVIEKKIRSDRRWGSRDRRFVSETTYDIVRYLRLFAYSSGQEYQTVENWWSVLASYLLSKKIAIPEWEVFEKVDFSSIEKRYEAGQKIRKIRESIPDWLDEMGNDELGEKWETTIENLNQLSKTILRANSLKINQLELQRKLNKLEIETDFVGQSGLILSKRRNLKNDKLYQNGFFEFQDYSSQQVSEYLEVEPNMFVIDACCGAGGKTLHLASLMQNKGQLIGLDINENKQRELSKRAKRAGISVKIENIDSEKVIKKHHRKADRLLIDAPCSGLGVLRRNPDAKWKLHPDFITKIKTNQRDILTRYSEMVKLYGKMVYATCSILPSENQDQIQWFLAKNPNFKLEKEKSILPQEEGFDGFYMALLVREN